MPGAAIPCVIMLTKIRYQGYAPNASEHLESEAKINQVQKRVPEGSAVIAMVESDGREYCCTIDVFLEKKSVYTSSIGSSLSLAVSQAVDSIQNKLEGVS